MLPLLVKLPTDARISATTGYSSSARKTAIQLTKTASTFLLHSTGLIDGSNLGAHNRDTAISAYQLTDGHSMLKDIRYVRYSLEDKKCLCIRRNLVCGFHDALRITCSNSLSD